MGVINQGILGKISGKVGPVQGASWKGIAYLKQYTIPSNPNTPAQQSQRGRFANCVRFAQSLYSMIIEKFWNPFSVKMSGYNAFISKNIKFLDNTTFYVTTNNLLSAGNVESAPVTTASLSVDTVSITWNTSTIGNGLSTDLVNLYVIKKDTYQIWSSATSFARSVGNGTVQVDSGLTASDLIAFATISRGSGITFEAGNSSAMQVS